jgi:hypothetical protein
MQLGIPSGLRHNDCRRTLMANLTIEMPDDLVHRLERIASVQHKSLQELAIEQMEALAEGHEYPAGSPVAVLRATNEPPHLMSADVDELDAAIVAARLPVRASDPLAPNAS